MSSITGHKRKLSEGTSAVASATSAVVPCAPPLEVGDPVPYDIPEFVDVKGLSLDQGDDDPSELRYAKIFLKEYAWRAAVKAYKRAAVSLSAAFPGELLDLVMQYDVYVVLMILQHESLAYVDLHGLDGPVDVRAFDSEWHFAFETPVYDDPMIDTITDLMILLVPPKTIRAYAATAGSAVKWNQVSGRMPVDKGARQEDLTSDRRLVVLARALSTAHRRPSHPSRVEGRDDENRPRFSVVADNNEEGGLLLDGTIKLLARWEDRGDSEVIFPRFRIYDGACIHMLWNADDHVYSRTFQICWSSAGPSASVLYEHGIPCVSIAGALFFSRRGFLVWSHVCLVLCLPERMLVVFRLRSGEFVSNFSAFNPGARPDLNVRFSIKSVVCAEESQTCAVTFHNGAALAITFDHSGEPTTTSWIRFSGETPFRYIENLGLRVF